ncbi:MAG: hypothetical protein ACQEQC_06520 [Elusimicrobiota bacterium]
MKVKKCFRIIILLVFGIFLADGMVLASGAGLSYFQPSTGEGGLGLGLGLEVGFGEAFTLEPRANYFSFDGLETTDEYCNSGWFKTKTALLDFILKVPFNAGEVNPYIFGGYSVFLNFGMDALEGNIDRDFIENTGYSTVTSSFKFDKSPGYGYSVGGGLKYKNIDFGIRAYKARAELNLKGDYIAANSGETAVTQNYSPKNSALILDGLLFSLTVEF